MRCREKGSFIRFSSSCYTLVRFDVTVEVIVILYIQDENNQKLTQFEHHHGDKQRPLVSGPNLSKLHGSAGCYCQSRAMLSVHRFSIQHDTRSSCSKVSCSEQAPPCWTAKCVCACVCLRVCVWASQGRSWSKQSVITPAESEAWKTWSGVMDQTDRVTELPARCLQTATNAKRCTLNKTV